ncbi:MAG: tetratricopeptide repeat protein [Candidatus Poribacteria bacterium]|nr:tetratricopeptide repeat protein [Candidatus Poribacteria bacterium]
MLPYLFISLLVIGQPQSAERQLLYAEDLFDQQAYPSAILEYKRFLFYHPGADLDDFVRYRLAQSYYYQDDRALARQMFREFTEIYPDSLLYRQAQLMLGKTYFDAEEYSTARSIFFQVINTAGDEWVTAQTQYLRSWCYLHGRDWLRAISEFRKVEQFQPDSPLSPISTQLANTTLANTPLPLKSPKQAQWMSTFLPGAGQIYAGKVRNGLISTAINAAFFYLLVDSIREERYVDAVGLYLVGARFYWGNRSNAKKWAIEHNRRLEADLIRQLKQQAENVEQMPSLPK